MRHEYSRRWREHLGFQSSRFLRAALVGTFLALVTVSDPRADEGGASFWCPGQYASFAAQPMDPGFNLAVTWYSYAGSVEKTAGLGRGRRALFGLDSAFNSFLLTPTYTPPATLAGGTVSLSLTGLAGYNRLSGSLRLEPSGLFVSRGESLTTGGDLYPQVSVAWTKGDHSWMTYLMGGVPVGSYDPNRYAEIGIGHWAADVGGAYTYADEASGLEFSATLGFTYNWENPDTHYRNGIDAHLDLGATKALSEEASVGLVGYLYHQLTGDSGAGATRGAFYSRVAALGVQAGHTFTIGGTPVDVNLRGYYEFDAEHRTKGSSVYLVASVPLGGKKR